MASWPEWPWQRKRRNYEKIQQVKKGMRPRAFSCRADAGVGHVGAGGGAREAGVCGGAGAEGEPDADGDK